MDHKRLKTILEENNQPAFRYKQITKAVFVDAIGSFEEISTLPKELRTILSDESSVLPFTLMNVVISSDKRAMKALFMLSDGKIIESVLISPKPEMWSACISCQVGCAMSCAFCATGQLGLKRDLTSDEIVSQAIFWRQYLKQEGIKGTYANIVYMGMGEPFMNWKNVKESIEILTDKDLCNFPNRGISVSTSGIAAGIEKFADTFGQVNLAISLHFASDEKRSTYMPVNKGNDLARLRESLQYYFRKNKRKLFIEYIMLDQINDTHADALMLVDYLRSIGTMYLLHVNLIRYNTIDSGFVPSSKTAVQAFKKDLDDQGISCTIRKSIGDDIHGACGQLAGQSEKK